MYKYSMFNQYKDTYMNYEKLYENLIANRRKLGTPEGYTEKHHIIPRSFGGTDDPVNLIALTAREHFMAHRFLARIHPDTGMVHAVFKMACSNKTMGRYKVTNRVYEQLRMDHAHRVSTDEVSKQKKSLASKGKKQSPEHIKARTDSRKQSGEWLTDETRKKISESNKGKAGFWKGKPIPQEFVEKRKQTMKERDGWAWTDERKEAQRNRLKGKPSKKPPVTEEYKQQLREEKSKKVTCPHCGKQGTMLIMPRWHFDNCKVLTQK
jgi:hypothetical protein